ncbi:MAG: hydroxymethylpyrimidine/phosphomethylpyrimidine kinase [Candidatus Dadabacteria bacterium]|nr:MAG: hydroxymethylpyrimidine/phosphomethylpyrimidine kinase [Candidatus Dadabacteria bacterium]
MSLEDNHPAVVTIAGLDPSGCAGLAADIKTFEALGVAGRAVASAITVQSETKLLETVWLGSELILKQLKVLLEESDIKYFKIGVIESLPVLRKILSLIRAYDGNAFILWDPIVSSSSGYKFHENLPDRTELVSILKQISLITPNIPEAEWLFGQGYTNGDLFEFSNSAAIILKGGHQTGSCAIDRLYADGELSEFSGERLNILKRGTGCVYSAALLAYLAHGLTLKQAIGKAKEYINKYLVSSSSLRGYHTMVA